MFKVLVTRKLIILFLAVIFPLSASALDFNKIQRSANQSHAKAKYNIGTMTYNDKGVVRNKFQAKKMVR